MATLWHWKLTQMPEQPKELKLPPPPPPPRPPPPTTPVRSSSSRLRSVSFDSASFF